MFIPLGDDNSERTITPYVTWVIIAINAVVWFFQLKLGDSFTYAYSAVPFELSKGVDLAQTININTPGGTFSLKHFAGPSPIQFTLLSSIFMHGSWMHIIGNMAYLFIFGDQIEDRLGHFKFVVFYLVCGFMASVAHILVDPGSQIPSLGASGAIAGVLGAYLILYPKNLVKVLLLRSLTYLPAFIVLGGWIAMQVFGQMGSSGHGGGVAYMAHIGGFFAGLGLIKLFGGFKKVTI